MCKAASQWEPACDSGKPDWGSVTAWGCGMAGRGAQEGGDPGTPTADSCCMDETNSAVMQLSFS